MREGGVVASPIAEEPWKPPALHFTPSEPRALEEDLELASRIQRELLPKHDAQVNGWELAYHYRAAGPVSGDYCDLIQGDTGETYFLVGDVAGHGIAAALLMSHLSALLRTLVSTASNDCAPCRSQRLKTPASNWNTVGLAGRL